MISTQALASMREALEALISHVEITNLIGDVLVSLPYPGLKAKATDSGKASKWRVVGHAGETIASNVIGKGLTLKRTDIRYGAEVTLDGLSVEVVNA